MSVEAGSRYLWKGKLAIMSIVKYMLMIMKNWWVNSEVTVEEDKCQLRGKNMTSELEVKEWSGESVNSKD